MTQILDPRESRTQNLAPYLTGPPALRRPAAAETEVFYIVDALPVTIATVEPYQLPPVPQFVPLATLFQEPPTGPVPPPVPPAPTKLYPEAFEIAKPWLGRPGVNRRPAPGWLYGLVGAGLASIAWSALGLAVLAVVR